MRGRDNISKVVEGIEAQPVENEVKTNCTEPPVKPVTNPELETDATAGFRLCQLPPEEGKSWVVLPGQIGLGPEICIVGLFNTVTGADASELHPVALSVNIKVVCPGEMPNTTPWLLIEAIVGFEDVQIPVPTFNI